MLIAARQIWLEHGLRQDMGLWLEAGRVARIAPIDGATADLEVPLALPLLTDLQVNGGGGVMINGDPTPEGIARVAAAHRGRGTGAILATVITDSQDVIEAAGRAALVLRGETGCVGLHIEGPHIAPERRGTHSAAHIRPLDRRMVDFVCNLRREGLPVMLTLAPERADPDLMAELVESGAVLSGGHSTATAEETRDALARGLRAFTHLYNAMPPMTSRAPGILGAALNSEAFAGIIVDGIHVDWDMVRIALRARPRPGLTFPVSDAMATVGGPEEFTLYGETIRVQDGALVNAEGSLAGAHLDLVQSLRNLVEHVGVPLAEAIPMVSDIPRAVMRLPACQIAEGMAVDDLLMLSEHFEILELP
ncbi:MAG: N-acetylglucosamine-6-phosphate deacetylase [Pseudomonadota bacterium]